MLVADGETYLLARNIGNRAALHLEVVEHDTRPNPPAHELASDRPGRRNDAVRQTSDGVQPWGKSAMEETDWHRVAEDRFATHVAQELSRWASLDRFRNILIIAAPRTLGALRQAYDARLKPMILAEIDKDLTNLPIDKIEAAITGFASPKG